MSNDTIVECYNYPHVAFQRKISNNNLLIGVESNSALPSCAQLGDFKSVLRVATAARTVNNYKHAKILIYFAKYFTQRLLVAFNLK